MNTQRSPEVPRVGVYIDFDNIVISRYDQVHRRGAFQSDEARSHSPADDGQVQDRLRKARVDVDAIIDYASSFGRVVVSRAYADWSQPVNAGYRQQLIDRAVDLTQMFPIGPRMKNGADIRLAVDVIEDLFRLDDVTHVVIVAGDSDYVALAQRAKRLGRTVIGVGVAGSTSRALKSACDEFADYDALLDADEDIDADEGSDADKELDLDADGLVAAPAPRSPAAPADAVGKPEPTSPPTVGEAPPAVSSTTPRKTSAAKKSTAPKKAAEASADTRKPAGAEKDPPRGATTEKDAQAPPSTDRAAQRRATQLLMRAMRLIHAKNEDEPWLSYGAVKNQMIRMDPAFTERPLGFPSFTEFVASRASIVETSKPAEGRQSQIRLRPNHR